MSESEEKQRTETVQTLYSNVALELSKGDLTFKLSAPPREFTRQMNSSIMQMQTLADALQVFGEEEEEVTQISSNYSVQLDDRTIFVDASSGAVVITLLSLTQLPLGHRLTIIKVDATSNAVTITPAGGDTIEGASTLALTARYQKALLLCSSGTWLDERGSESV